MNFATRTKDGIVWVERSKDEAFRKALMDGVPKSLRNKMFEALSNVPNASEREFSDKHFGKELPVIMEKVSPLLIELDRFLTESKYNLPGLFDWLDVTGYGNSHALINVFKEWAEMRLSNG